MAKYVAGDTGRKDKDGNPTQEVIKLGISHFNTGEEIPEAVIAKLHPKTLENDLKRGIIKRVEDAPAAKQEAKQDEKTGETKIQQPVKK